MHRRNFLLSCAALGAGGFALGQEAAHQVAIIGHTGRGDYGHGLDTVWLKIPGAQFVGVADPDDAGRKKELAKLKLGEGFGFPDYRMMLEKASADFVSVCPRHVDQHADMMLAAIDAGVKGIYVEKPYVRTPDEADRVAAAAKKAGTRIAVAHRNRYHPVMPLIQQLIADGKLGKLLEIRGRGKGDRRGGGEDLWVLGTHVLNLLHFFGGQPRSCSATMFADGKPVSANDVYEGAEGLGPLAGNELHARYEMEDGVIAYFDSIANDDTKGAGFGLQLVGSEGIINIQCDRDPVAHLIPGNPFQPDEKKPRPWIPITSAGVGIEESDPEKIAQVHNHVIPVLDLIDVCEQNRQPVCNHEEGAMTVEMVSAVFASHIEKGRAVKLPLATRNNPLEDW